MRPFQSPHFLLPIVLLSLVIFWEGCGFSNTNNNNSSWSTTTSTTTSTSGAVTLSGSVIFPSNTVVASIFPSNQPTAGMKGAVNHSVLRVYINNLFYGFLAANGSFTFPNVPIATEYKIEIKNPNEILLLMSLQSSTVHSITPTTTAQALALIQARISSPSLTSASVPSTTSAILSLTSLIEQALADTTALNSTLTTVNKTLFATAAISTGILSAANALLAVTTSTTTTTTTTTTSTTTATAIFSSSPANVTQLDRVGRPAINLLLAVSDKQPFNQSDPVNDRTLYKVKIASAIQQIGGVTAVKATSLADTLTPDLLTLDTSKTVFYPNGRGVADDVIDVILNSISSGTITTDSVNANDASLSAGFPYLGSPF